MECVQGTGIVGGIASGTITIYGKREYQVKMVHVDDTEAELNRYELAKRGVSKQLDILYEKAQKEVGETNAQVFEAHKIILDDEDYNNSVMSFIDNQKVNAEYAVAKTCEVFLSMFSYIEEDYIKERSIDIKDVSDKIIAALTGCEYDSKEDKAPAIIMASELTPSETIQMDKKLILAFVTKKGSKNSHTAILAKAMNIPAVAGIDIKEQWNGKECIVDGDTGTIYVEPDEQTASQMQKKREKLAKKQELLQKMKGKETIAPNGRKIKLYANIGGESDAKEALANDAEGIGLFRTEFLYLGGEDYPTEEEQFNTYRYVAEMMGGKEVVIRTLDIGADKQADYFGLESEENPAMGYRAIRICLDRRDMFKTQLRAILRASAYGKISIMLPMIISVQEVQATKKIIKEAEKELTELGITYGKFKLGVMIETPAAVMISDLLAKEVDFFSIGTNDLAQYTLAIDRQNQKLEKIYDAHHPAVLRMIEYVIKNAHENNVKVGICGELGSDIALINKFIEMGIDELSVVPSMILEVRQAVIGSD